MPFLDRRDMMKRCAAAALGVVAAPTMSWAAPLYGPPALFGVPKDDLMVRYNAWLYHERHRVAQQVFPELGDDADRYVPLDPVAYGFVRGPDATTFVQHWPAVRAGQVLRFIGMPLPDDADVTGAQGSLREAQAQAEALWQHACELEEAGAPDQEINAAQTRAIDAETAAIRYRSRSLDEVLAKLDLVLETFGSEQSFEFKRLWAIREDICRLSV